MIKEIIDHWCHDWKSNRLLFWLESTGTFLSVVSTTILSCLASHPPMVLCYSVWFLGSSLIMIGAKIRKAAWMFLLMAFNTTLNIVGLVVLMLH